MGVLTALAALIWLSRRAPADRSLLLVAPPATIEATSAPEPTATAPVATPGSSSAVSPTPAALSLSIALPSPTSPPPPTIQPSPAAAATGTITATVVVNLLQDGSFTLPWEAESWQLEVRRLNGDQTIEPLPAGGGVGPGIRLRKSGAGALILSQEVILPGDVADLQLRGRWRLIGSRTGTGEEGRAVFLLTYRAGDGRPLGYSIWLDGSAPGTTLWGLLPMPPDDALRALRRAEDDAWQMIDLELGRELSDRLPDLDAAEIKQIGVTLLLIGSDGCSPEECRSTIEAADLLLTPSIAP